MGASGETDSVFVSGIFNVLHPGHIRLLRFAKTLGQKLIVGVLSDDLAGQVATTPESQRLDAIEGLRAVDECFIIRDSVTESIERLQPGIVVKGREHRAASNSEEEVLRAFGGRLVFSSGDSFFNVTDLIVTDRGPSEAAPMKLPVTFMSQHNLSLDRVIGLLGAMSAVRVLVIGDVIVDEYVSCHPLGMSREDPTLVVTPVETNRFVGGAAIVAAHAAHLGRSATLLSVAGDDEQAKFLRDTLDASGVSHVIWGDATRTTSTKQRYRASGKTLLRVSHLTQDSISEELQAELLDLASEYLGNHDVLIFSDFNYGVLPQTLVSELTQRGRSANLTLAADSQASSQIGDISRFLGMDLLTPTEFEARMAVRNFEDGLVVLADQLLRKADARAVLMTLGEDGVFIRSPAGGGPAFTDRVPALNPNPVDVAGAGDSLLVVSSMALSCGANLQEAALLGSMAAAIQVAYAGNRPISSSTIREAFGI